MDKQLEKVGNYVADAICEKGGADDLEEVSASLVRTDHAEAPLRLEVDGETFDVTITRAQPMAVAGGP